MTRYLVTGASGYVGSRLAPRLLERGAVRCLLRNPHRLRGVPWAEQCEIVCGDLLDAQSLRKACADVDVLYYLVHSLGDQRFAELDQRAAATTAAAARDAGVRRIVYLGGLHPEGELSDHLASRTEVGDILLSSGVPTIVLQAAVILGSGSTSFEMLRHLTDRLPIMIAPKWLANRIQPIAIADVLHYLVEAAELPEEINRSFHIGGPDIMTYSNMMQRYAAVAGLPRRRIIQVPALTPHLSAHWVRLVTPVPHAIAAQLVDSLVHEVVCTENDITQHITDPSGGSTNFARAIALALNRQDLAPQEWATTDAANPAQIQPTDPEWAGRSVCSIEHERQYEFSPDEVVRRASSLQTKSRVTFHSPASDAMIMSQQMSTTRAGAALLTVRVEAAHPGSRLTQQLEFAPRGLGGRLYWLLMAPVRRKRMARRASAIAGDASASTTVARCLRT